MTDQVEISPLSSTDVSELVKLWNECLTAHPMTIERFNSLFLSDVNGVAKLNHASFVAKTDRIIGFVIAYQRNIPAPGLGLEPDLGYLTAIAVKPDFQQQGIGTALLSRAISALDTSEILLSGRTGSAPAAAFPGVDLDNYQESLNFFLKNEFEPLAIANSMSREINAAIPVKVAAEVAIETEIDQTRLAEFVGTAFPGDWADVAVAKWRSNSAEFSVVSVNGDYAGFAVWNGGWFGPVGVAEQYRSYGLGKLLVQNAINQMHQAGVNRIYFTWADEWVVPFYQRLGFEINRTYQRLIWRRV
ncbi:MAG: GNAT family N-acetyltransferase [Actinobacteria bacterium]|uniref:Unannotated protein n=1 Tax=freshwater metagenome TaxID=449393 RepID=A0A6J6F1S6_9ZZZZ|nr:GNAT family N-acetyltransferase [Actinomycetota bacterium]